MKSITEATLKHLERFVLLPDMVLIKQFPLGRWGIGFRVEKSSPSEFCPSCTRECFSVHLKRCTKIKDASLRGKAVVLHIMKRQFSCKPCGRIFTEHFPGIFPRKRHTERFRREVNWASANFSDMKKVEKFTRSSAPTCLKARNDELKKKAK